MPRYYCDYCDTYLTHDSATVRTNYQQYEAQLNQSLIDQKVKEHLGAFRPPIAPYPRPGLAMAFRPRGLELQEDMVPPPGAPFPGQISASASSMFLPPPPPYQGNMSLPTSGGSDGSNANALAPEPNQ